MPSPPPSFHGSNVFGLNRPPSPLSVTARNFGRLRSNFETDRSIGISKFRRMFTWRSSMPVRKRATTTKISGTNTVGSTSNRAPNEVEEQPASPGFCPDAGGNDNASLRFGRVFSGRGDEILSSEAFCSAGENGCARDFDKRWPSGRKTGRGETPEAGQVIFGKTAGRASLYKSAASRAGRIQLGKDYVSYI